MKLERYLTEFSREHYGKGITFVDIDDTMFRTFAKVRVFKNGKLVRKLDNAEYNYDHLAPDEEYDFGEFRDATVFRKTSIPIPQTIARVKKMLAQIRAKESGSKIVFLTARQSFRDLGDFYKLFKDHGIIIDKKTVHVEFSGDRWVPGSTVDDVKRQVVMQYIKNGDYRRVRMIDDHRPNLKMLKDIEKNLPKSIEKKVIDKYNLDMETETLPPISFYPLWVQSDGSLKPI